MWLGVGSTLASGFAVIERDAAGLGRAYAGQAAMVAAGSMSFNPAALPEQATVSGSLHGLRNTLAPEDAGVDALAPALYGAYRGFGVGLYAPFGLATDYPADWSGRYAALFSQIRSARIQIAGGVQASETLRLGAGVFLQHLSADLSNAYPLGPLDSEIRIDGEDNAPGWSAGALWHPSPDLSLGLSYTSPVEHGLHGRATLPSGSTSTRVDLTTPEALSAGLAWQLRPAWRLSGGATWTRWSRLERLDIRLSSGQVLAEVHDWRDTWRIALGVEHTHGPLTLRAGLARDQSPVPDADRRYPRLPDSDRTWGALGIGYRAGDWVVDVGYAHLWFDARDGAHPPVAYRSSTDILALGITRSW
jgi:long-chain fatty acid transport protein